MLTPEYLNKFTDGYLGMCDVLNEQITRDIARRIAKTGGMTSTAKWQARQAKQSGALMQDVIREVSVLTRMSEKEVYRMFRDAGLVGIQNDAAPLIRAGKLKSSELRMSDAMKQVMNAAAEKCKGEISNLTLTTAAATQQKFLQALNEAYMKVSSGAFSYQEAIRQAIRSAAVDGTSVLYSSGHTSKIDVAMRVALLTGVNQTAGKLTELYAEDMDAKYYEVTAHAGARPSHATWQGRVYRIEGSDGDHDNFYDATGYGTGEGLCGWNCRHSFFPYWPGISKPAYTKDMLDSYSEPKYSYNGDLLTEYDCMQRQRAYERSIREYKRILAGYDSYIESTDSEEQKAYFREKFTEEAVKLKKKEKQMKEFCRQTNRRPESERTQVVAVKDHKGNLVSFNRSVSAKAVWANRKAKKR